MTLLSLNVRNKTVSSLSLRKQSIRNTHGGVLMLAARSAMCITCTALKCTVYKNGSRYTTHSNHIVISKSCAANALASTSRMIMVHEKAYSVCSNEYFKKLWWLCVHHKKSFTECQWQTGPSNVVFAASAARLVNKNSKLYRHLQPHDTISVLRISWNILFQISPCTKMLQQSPTINIY